MSVLRINGGKRLRGVLKVQGAKNSALPILAATLLARGETVLHNCPRISDADAAADILRRLGCAVKTENGDVIVRSGSAVPGAVPDSLMRGMRASVIFLGAMLAAFGEAVVTPPGGCELGPRPVDLHLMALRALGAETERNDDGTIVCRASRLRGGRIDLPTPSVGATENALLAACAAEGETVIRNAAREPEIVDLAEFLTGIGAHIRGAGTGTIAVEGARMGGDTEHTVIPDRIAAATYLAAAASAGGDIELAGTDPRALGTVTGVFSEMGCRIEAGEDTIRFMAPERLRSARPIATRPYPGFPTDAQPPVMAAALRAEGTTVFVENLFEDRYRHVPELLKMGADIKTGGRTAVVTGVGSLRAARVRAADLRGGAALAVAALACEGETVLGGLEHIDRGYDGLETALRALGADVTRA